MPGRPFDVEAVRAQFPILTRQVHGKPLVYLDSTASSQKPQAVIERLATYYAQGNANVHRGVHTLSEEATAAFEASRAKVARFINAASSKEIIWTRNATEAINLVAYSWGSANLKPGDEVLITEMEHHSNIVPWQLACQRTGATLRHVPVDDEGFLRLDLLPTLLTPRTRLFAFTAMSNVLGTIVPVAELTAAAHAVGALALVDGAQSVPHLPVDVQALGADFLVFSGHKMCGPTGIGVLYGRRQLLEAMPPFMSGGDMIKEVHLDVSRWNTLPWKFEAGTPAIAEAIGLGAAVDYLDNLGMPAIQAHEHALVTYAMQQLQQVEGLRILGPDADHRGGVVAFTLGDIHPHDLAAILDGEGIAIRAGHHCAQPLHDRYGLPASARASFYLYNTAAEVDQLVAALDKAREMFAL
ncbi:MAG: cysteine desulfurase [Anaerolineae bacterium]|nr:cysteine desulfurase [Anaerolineae bacterium]MBK7202743.1 cysteine desulfurase [Anaerolineae bacterium]MBK9092028.1 cysteine desulfurase [Anaerolineae bacterium]MBK9232209.1 cysteine desulfurase [Anaerolineae bacterium]